MWRQLFMLLLLYSLKTASVAADSILFDDCGSLYFLDEVLIDGCSSLPCVFNNGSSQNITFKLYAEFDSEQLQQTAIFYFRGLNYGLTVNPEALCGEKLSCPLRSGDNVSFSSAVQINDTLPLSSMTGELYWTTTNENSVQVMCMKTEVTLQT